MSLSGSGLGLGAGSGAGSDAGSGKDLRLTLQISGMSCSSCVGRIERALNSHNGVTSSDVQLLSHKAVIMYLPDHIGPDEVIQLVEEGGYGAKILSEKSQTQLHFDVSGMVCASCPPRIESALRREFPIAILDITASQVALPRFASPTLLSLCSAFHPPFPTPGWFTGWLLAASMAGCVTLGCLNSWRAR